MSTIELVLIAVGLSMDVFAVAIGKGLSVERVSPKQATITGVWFGGFQALMPIMGYLLGISFAEFVESTVYQAHYLRESGNAVSEAIERRVCFSTT